MFLYLWFAEVRRLNRPFGLNSLKQGRFKVPPALLTKTRVFCLSLHMLFPAF